MKVLTFVGGAVVLIVLSLYRGLALSLLWGWFVVPTFDVPSLPVIAAIGISTMVSMFTPTTTDKVKWTDVFLRSFIATTVTIAFGWLWSLAL